MLSVNIVYHEFRDLLLSVPSCLAAEKVKALYTDVIIRVLITVIIRNVLGTLNLGEILSQRESIANEMKAVLDVATAPWGVMVERVEVNMIVVIVMIIMMMMMMMIMMMMVMMIMMMMVIIIYV